MHVTLWMGAMRRPKGSGVRRRDNSLSPNGTHQRPHADGSARGRDGLVIATTSIARGHALYLSRLAAWVCSASRRRIRVPGEETFSIGEFIEFMCLPT
jgi:hypothetical protein